MAFRAILVVGGGKNSRGFLRTLKKSGIVYVKKTLYFCEVFVLVRSENFVENVVSHQVTMTGLLLVHRFNIL